MSISTQSRTSWRISLDRAWRSLPLRRRFEAECGLPPLADNTDDQSRQAFDGLAEAYHDRFLLWATKRLGLEREAPDSIQRKLAG